MKGKNTPSRADRKKTNAKLYLRNNWQLYAMLLIPVIYMILFKYKPMLGVVVAFKKFNIFQGIWNSPWIGLAHFKEAFTSRDFWDALKNTLILNMGDLIIGFPIPIFLAVFLNELRSGRVRKVTQTLLYLPNFLSWVIISGIVTQLFANTGMVNNIANALGAESIPFLSNSGIWRFVYWFSGVWQGSYRLPGGLDGYGCFPGRGCLHRRRYTPAAYLVCDAAADFFHDNRPADYADWQAGVHQL